MNENMPPTGFQFNPNSVDTHLGAIHATLVSHTDIMNRIFDEARRTNGRVTKIEDKQVIFEKLLEGRWKYLTGGAAAITLFGGSAYALLHFLFK